MNSKTANSVPIKDIVEGIAGLREGKAINNEIWYKSPFREEKEASFKIDIAKNNWIDFARTQKVGTPIDFVMEYRNCTVSQALSIIEDTGLGYKSTYRPPSKQNQTNLDTNLFSSSSAELKFPKQTKFTQETQKREQLLKYYEDEHAKELRNEQGLRSESVEEEKGIKVKPEQKNLL